MSRKANTIGTQLKWAAFFLVLLFLVIQATPRVLGQPETGHDNLITAEEAQGPTPTPTPTPTCTPGGSDGLLYALNDDDSPGSFVYGFSVNEATGALTALAGFPVAAQSGGINSIVSERMVADQANLRLYVINDGSNTVSAYSINPTTGALTPMPFSPISLFTGVWNTIAVHPSGSPLVVANNADNGLVHSFVITPTTATAAAGSPYNMGTGVAGFSSRFSRNGDYYYVGGNMGSNIGGFGVDATTGVLTALPGSPFPAGATNVIAYATDSAGRLYSVDSANGLRAFTSSAGALTPVTGNPFASGLTQRRFGIVHPSENFYMVAGNTGNNVGVYQISGSGAATTLTAVTGSPFATSGTTANCLASNAAGTFLYVANRVSRNITTFSVNTGTGVLTFQSVQPSNTLGTSGAINGFAYVAGGTCPPVQLESVKSQKTHGGAGTFDIDFPISGTPRGVECRSGGGNYTVLLKFSCTLTSVGTVSASENGCGTLSAAGMISGDTYVVSLTGVCNAGLVTITLTDVNDSCGNHSDTVSTPQMGFLIGDTTGNGVVNSSDVGQVKSQSGSPVSAQNFRQDLNADGSINSSDIISVKLRVGTALP